MNRILQTYQSTFLLSYGENSLNLERKTLNIADDEKVFVRVEQKTGENEIVRYQYDNHLGSACLELDHAGQMISYEEYHPFGTTSYRSGRSETEVSLKRYKYCGKERDEETGLYYYGMRYYSAWICRFISTDPLQFKYPELTPFQYASNCPITMIDLDGAEGVKPSFWSKLKSTGESVGKALKDTANSVGNTIGEAANSVGNAIGEAANAVWNTIGEAANAVGNWVDEHPRTTGAIQMMGGFVEAVGGGVGGVVTAETGFGAALGYTVLVNGIDNMITGAKQMVTGERENTLLNKGIAKGAEVLGADTKTAQTVANWSEIAFTLGINITNSINIVKANNIGAVVAVSPAVNGTSTAAEGGITAFRSFTSGNFRHNLGKMTGGIPANSQAHHVFPQAKEFSSFFNSRGININDPRFGSWWNSTSHGSNAKQYNAYWRQWIGNNPNATINDVMNYGRQIMNQYGLTIYF